MLQGVIIKKIKVHHDTHEKGSEVVKKPGILAEVLRADEKLLKKFGQTTFTITHPGTIKAFHYHARQDDLWFMATGRALIVLYDLRPKSQTYQQTQIIKAGENNYQLIVIPAGVAHGFKVLGKKPVLLFYHTTKSYNAAMPDEKNIPYNDPAINFFWHKYR